MTVELEASVRDLIAPPQENESRIQAHETSMHCEMYEMQPDMHRARWRASQVHDDEVSVQWEKVVVERFASRLQRDQTCLQEACACLHKACARVQRDIAVMSRARDV
jgi:hypothetical protein